MTHQSPPLTSTQLANAVAKLCEENGHTLRSLCFSDRVGTHTYETLIARMADGTARVQFVVPS